MTRKKVPGVSLHEWADKNDVPYRTTLNGAAAKKLAATRKQKVQLTRTVTVLGYFLPANATVFR